MSFLLRVDGVAAFDTDLRKSARFDWQGTQVHALSLQSILKSKRFVSRPMHIPHIPLIAQALKLARRRRQ